MEELLLRVVYKFTRSLNISDACAPRFETVHKGYVRGPSLRAMLKGPATTLRLNLLGFRGPRGLSFGLGFQGLGFRV